MVIEEDSAEAVVRVGAEVVRVGAGAATVRALLQEKSSGKSVASL
jgi:hypothetical protein